jgi:hypothetical protein
MFDFGFYYEEHEIGISRFIVKDDLLDFTWILAQGSNASSNPAIRERVGS